MMYRERYDDGLTKCLALVSPGVYPRRSVYIRKWFFVYIERFIWVSPF